MVLNSIRLWDRDTKNHVDLKVAVLPDGDALLVAQTGIKASVIEVVPVLDTSAYVAGDVLSDTFEIPNAVSVEGGSVMIHSVSILDKDYQGGAFDIVFLRSNVSLGTKNAAITISDSDAEEILGIISVAAGDFVDLTNSMLATKSLVGLILESDLGSTSIFASLVSRDTKTYTASGLMLKFGMALD